MAHTPKQSRFGHFLSRAGGGFSQTDIHWVSDIIEGHWYSDSFKPGAAREGGFTMDEDYREADAAGLDLTYRAGAIKGAPVERFTDYEKKLHGDRLERYRRHERHRGLTQLVETPEPNWTKFLQFWRKKGPMKTMILVMFLATVPAYAETSFLWSNGEPLGMTQQAGPNSPALYFGNDGMMGLSTPAGPNSLWWLTEPDGDLSTGFGQGGPSRIPAPPLPPLFIDPPMPTNRDIFCPAAWARRGLC